jgi:DNA topoisomerase-1
MKLVIVESPTKAKTISGFLGGGYDVASSYGHIRDLPKSTLSIDVEHGFAPHYVIPTKAKGVVADLKKKAAEADEVVLATDEDREGEAIAWHLAQALGLAKDAELRADKLDPRVKRIVFHEITKNAIEEALANPRGLDINLVDAQQARRVLDRLVGYELSPFLWRKVRFGLSAGRVQSVALRLVVEREREIQAFREEEYWTIEGEFVKKGDKKKFTAQLAARLQTPKRPPANDWRCRAGSDGGQVRDGQALGKMVLRTETEAKTIVADLAGASYTVGDVATKEVSRYPAPPFTTSTLQQEAARKLGLSAKQTMFHAQRLYEQGFITYMRTDSVNLAKSALLEAREVITRTFGKEYALDAPRAYQTRSKGAQEAHEAIRPTDLARGANDIAGDRSERRLYDLILKRTIACQMQPARFEQTSANIVATTHHLRFDRPERLTVEGPPTTYSFRATGQVVIFDGFIRVYTEGRDDNNNHDNDNERTLPPLKEGDALNCKKLDPFQHFTEPPPRYTDATLVKALEANGIGRPSTYAPTLSTIQERGYVEKLEKKYRPTDIGFVVNDLLVEHFPEIVDVNFTSHVEEELDDIAEGKINWVTVCEEFYGPFKKHLDAKEVSVEKYTETSETPCPHCGKPMVIKFGRFGKFMACPEPGSKVTLPMPEEAAKIKGLEEKTKDERCPICSRPMEVKRGRFGFFLGCTDYPKCKGISKIWEKTGFKCPQCRAQRGPEPVEGQIGDIVLKKSRGRGKPFYACTRYPACTFLMNKKPESEADLAAALEVWRKKEAEPKKPTRKTTKRNE